MARQRMTATKATERPVRAAADPARLSHRRRLPCLVGSRPGRLRARRGHPHALIAGRSTDSADPDSLSTATSAGAHHWSAPARLARVPGGTFGPILAAAHNRARTVPSPCSGKPSTSKVSTSYERGLSKGS